jgi:disulfide bond formation protein DsbB
MSVTAVGFFIPRYKKRICMAILFFSLCSMLFAGFHVGVEQGWFNYNSSCVSENINQFNSVDELKREIMSKDINPCDMVGFTFLKLSLAGWNFIISMAMLIFAFVGIQGLKRK